jgi:hypothetical protein
VPSYPSTVELESMMATAIATCDHFASDHYVMGRLTLPCVPEHVVFGLAVGRGVALLGPMLKQVDGGLLTVSHHTEAGVEVGQHGSDWAELSAPHAPIISNGPSAV